MKRLPQLVTIEIIFCILIMFVIGAAQFSLTKSNIESQIQTHISDIENSIDKFDESEQIGRESIDELLQIRADAMAFILKKESFTPDEDNLAEYASMLDVDHIYITDKDGQNLVSTKGNRSFNVARLTHRSQTVTAKVDNERTVVLEMPMEYMNDVFKEAFSWRDAVKNVVVGRRGYAFIFDGSTGKVMIHPDEEAQRKPVEFFFLSQKQSIRRGYGVLAVDNDVLVGGIVKVEEKEEDENENITGMEQYLVCGIPVEEVVMDFFTSGLIFILVFFAVTILFLCYLVFEQKLRETDQAYEQKLKTYPVLFLVVMLVISLFLSRVNTVSTYLMNCAMRADDATSTMETYEKISDKIQKIFDQEYLIECRIAADILKKMPQYHTRSGMKEISTLLHVDNTYLFDKKGKTIVTDSLYDHFALSKDENSQSYAFRPLLEGVDYVVQEPMNDDSSGSYMQYVGVSIRDKNDLANGFAQIAISPQTMEKLQENINVSAKLNDINVGNDGLALVLDSDGVVTLSPRKTWVGKTAKELGILKKQRVDGFSGYVTINGTNYFAGANVTESGDVVFVVMPRKNAGGGQGKVILLLGAIAFMCMFMEAMVCRQPDTAVKEKKKKNKKGRFDKLWSGFRKQAEAGSPKRFFEKIDIPVNESMDTRWQNTHRKWADRTPEDKIFFILKAGLILFSAYIITGYVLRDKFLYQDSMFLYIIDGKWERGLNLFAVSAGLLIICVIYSFVQIINQLLYWIARVSDTKTETICHLMRSLLKYGSVIAVFYYCLALFGLDTRTLVASAGIMSVIVGLGAQKLIMDVIAGLFLVFENQYSVGDIVDVGGWSGRVVEIGIRSTKIASFENVKSFNNSEITGLINYMAKEVCTISSEISVSYEESLPRLIEIFGKELPALQDRISGAVDAPYFDGVTSIGDSGIVLVFRAHVKSDLKYPAERDYHRELLLLFERNHITVPYSHLSLDGRLQVEKKS